MNINYELGNVIASETSFNDYKFPAQLPTEEWAGDEVRSYVNYIRPVANLFENDRENQNFSREIIDSLIYKTNKNAVVDGCKIIKTSVGGNNYYEVQENISCCSCTRSCFRNGSSRFCYQLGSSKLCRRQSRYLRDPFYR